MKCQGKRREETKRRGKARGRKERRGGGHLEQEYARERKEWCEPSAVKIPDSNDQRVPGNDRKVSVPKPHRNIFKSLSERA